MQTKEHEYLQWEGSNAIRARPEGVVASGTPRTALEGPERPMGEGQRLTRRPIGNGFLLRFARTVAASLAAGRANRLRPRHEKGHRPVPPSPRTAVGRAMLALILSGCVVLGCSSVGQRTLAKQCKITPVEATIVTTDRANLRGIVRLRSQGTEWVIQGPKKTLVIPAADVQEIVIHTPLK